MHTYSKSSGVTSHDIARRAHVSQSTVSRVLTGNTKVRKEARERVIAAVRELGYRPNATARAMRTSQTGNIGVVVSRLANPLYPELLQVLGKTLTAAGFRMVVWNSDELDEKAALDAVHESRVDGAIMTTATSESTWLYEALQVNTPVVLINRIVDGWPCDQVSSDNFGGGRIVAEYLVKSDRRRIGLIAGPSVASTIRDRQTGFRETLEALGHPIDQTLSAEVDNFSYKTGFEAASNLLGLPRPPDALFCVNDLIALGASDAARAGGVSVPEKLWIVGYDDIEMASWHGFNLTTIRQPLALMAETAVDLLAARVRGNCGACQHICLPNDLVVRGSTAG